MGSNNTPPNTLLEANHLLTIIAPAISSTGFHRADGNQYRADGLTIDTSQSPKVTTILGKSVNVVITPETVTVTSKKGDTVIAKWTTGAVEGHYIRTGKVNLIP